MATNTLTCTHDGTTYEGQRWPMVCSLNGATKEIVLLSGYPELDGHERFMHGGVEYQIDADNETWIKAAKEALSKQTRMRLLPPTHKWIVTKGVHLGVPSAPTPSIPIYTFSFNELHETLRTSEIGEVGRPASLAGFVYRRYNIITSETDHTAYSAAVAYIEDTHRV